LPIAVAQLEGVRERPRGDVRTIAVCRMRAVAAPDTGMAWKNP
jgi:hypothetical protein